MVALDFRSKEPIYRQIVNQIQDRLGSGELEPGQQLPTVRQLATELGVNFNTVARAYRLTTIFHLDPSSRPFCVTYSRESPP